MTCAHCRVTVVKNPLRTRERNYCHKCSGRYICDVCAAATRHPDYKHAQFEKVRDVLFEDAQRFGGLLGPAQGIIAASDVVRTAGLDGNLVKDLSK